ncbi:glycosyltransferase family 39 protein, partial [bacterium]|nr:glycosyltransferase family 39 protein [bacterium]
MNRRAEIATLIAILVGASVIRFWGITWGLPHAYHPDEGSILFHALGFGTGDLNPHWFRWPSLTMYVMFGIYGCYYVIGKLMGTFSVPPDLVKAYLTDLSPFWLMGRIVSAASGVVTVWITWLFGRKSFGSYVGLTAAAILAVLFLHVRDSHYATPDVMAAMIAAGSLLAALYACRSSRSSFILLSGFLAGLSASAKYPGALAAIGALVALVVLVRRRRGGLWLLPVSGVAIVAGFLIGTPYALLSSDEFTRDVLRQFTMVSEAGIAQEASSYAAGLREIVMESLGRGVGWVVMLMAAVGALLPIGLWSAKLSYAHRRHRPAALTGEPTIADAASAKVIAVSFSIAVLLVMSLLTVKRATYLTLALPSVAFLAAVGLEGLFARLAVRRHRALAAALVIIAAAAVPSVRYLSALAVVDTRTRAKEWV